ncbi:ankyrin repeat domain-containing protein [Flammeovirgaceae bacterium SG7u.111]|nr:ankyrin repeat domain-containing protein [Flammeovirgaceae bacterium SG7u.132]WPO35627.1 ankyrin repeat domain-containing protein [Flammeovirgaceae bacterium SG7u.111]
MFVLVSTLGLFSASAQDAESGILFKAIEKNNYEQVKNLLETGSDPNVTDMLRNTPLHVAAFHGHDKIILLLAEYDADLNALNKAQQTPLYSALHADQLLAVNALVESGANLSAKFTSERMTILHFAAKEKRYDITEKLLEAGADPKIKDRNGKKPIDYAKSNKDKGMASLLKDKRWK